MTDNDTYRDHDRDCSRDKCPCFLQGMRAELETIDDALEALAGVIANARNHLADLRVADRPRKLRRV